MDQKLSAYSRDSVVVTGLGYELPAALHPWFATGSPMGPREDASLSHDADPLPFLRVRKTLKFMSKQDRLAISAAARAVRSAGLTADRLDSQTRIAMCMGPIPFEQTEAMAVAEHSGHNGEFSMQRFCRDAYAEVNPLLLFACLPNMPAYHISANLNIRGGYYLTYPSCAESYMALQNAERALVEGQAMAVLYGGVSDQQNFLVQNHHQKTGEVRPAPDGAGFLVLETFGSARERGAAVLARLQELRILPHRGSALTEPTYCLGPAELPLEVARFAKRSGPALTHRFMGNGCLFESTWDK